jgi:hypothetical protein
MIFREEPGKEVLEPEDEIKKERANEGEDYEADCVLPGVHFDCGVDARKEIDPWLNWHT